MSGLPSPLLAPRLLAAPQQGAPGEHPVLLLREGLLYCIKAEKSSAGYTQAEAGGRPEDCALSETEPVRPLNMVRGPADWDWYSDEGLGQVWGSGA